jgi:DNA-binding NarL/FixJ family response regulator
MPNSPVRLTRTHASIAGQSGYRETLLTAASRRPAIANGTGIRQLSEIQREVLEQLCIGDTVATTARKVAISSPIARHRGTELIHELDLTNRLDAAVGASKRGWLAVE